MFKNYIAITLGWFDNFINQIGISPADFVVSGIILLGSSSKRLSYFSLKTPMLNPYRYIKKRINLNPNYHV
jgi:hypothetical protein